MVAVAAGVVAAAVGIQLSELVRLGKIPADFCALVSERGFYALGTCVGWNSDSEDQRPRDGDLFARSIREHSEADAGGDAGLCDEGCEGASADGRFAVG